MRNVFLRTGILAALALSMPVPAHAQFGRLGDAIKKKAKQVGADAIVGKEEPKKSANTSAAKAAPPMVITSGVLDQLAKGLAVESQKRSAYVKRDGCERTAVQTPEMMNIIASQGKAMEAAMNDKLTETQKMAAMQKFGEDVEVKKEAFISKRCGPVIVQLDDSELEAAGAVASGLTAMDYGLMKERVTAYCEAVARGSDTPSDVRMVFTPAEMQALKPRCGGLLKTLSRSN